MESFELEKVLLEVRGAEDVGTNHAVQVHRLLVAIKRQRVLLLPIQSHTIYVHHDCQTHCRVKEKK